MTDENLTACRADIENADRTQLAQDVGDLLAEVDHLRFLVRALIDSKNMGRGGG